MQWCQSTLGHLLIQPVQQVCYFGVYTIFVGPTASPSPARYTLEVEPPAIFTHQGSATIPLTGINAASVKTGANHGVVDLSEVSKLTTVSPHNRYRSLLQHFSARTTDWRCSAPTRNPALLALNWSRNSLRQASKVHGPKMFVMHFKLE